MSVVTWSDIHSRLVACQHIRQCLLHVHVYARLSYISAIGVVEKSEVY